MKKKTKLLLSSIGIVATTGAIVAPIIDTQTKTNKNYLNNNNNQTNINLNNNKDVINNVNLNNRSTNNTIVNEEVTLTGDKWNNTLPQSVSSPRNLYNDDLKNAIISANAIVQPIGSSKNISANDFDLIIQDQQPNTNTPTSGYNNTNGWAFAQLTFHPGTFYVNNQLNTTPVTKFIKIFGLMSLPETDIKNGFSNNDYNSNNPVIDTKNNTNSAKSYASSMSIQKVQQLFYDGILTADNFFTNAINLSKNAQDLNSWVHPSTIIVNNVTPNNDNGTVAVDATLYGYENWREYLYSDATRWDFKFTLSGYYAKNNPSDSKYFTTEIISPITINDFNQTLAENAISDNALTADAKDKILNYIVSNYSSVFNYLNPNASPISKDDINVSLNNSSYNFNNKKGYIYVDIELLNNKAWNNGTAVATKTFTKIPIYGFLNQQSTSNLVNTLNNTQASNQFTTTFSYDNAVQFLNDHKSEIYENLPPDATIIVDQNSYDNSSDMMNGIVHLKLNCSSYYDIGDSHYVNNNPPNSWLDFTISGFINSSSNPNAFTTTLNSGTLSGVNTILPQFANDSKNHSTDNTNVINAIKNYLISGNIQNLPPETTSIAPLDLNVNITGFNNLNGTVTVDVTLLNNKGWVNGQKQNITKTLTFSGLKQVQESKYNYDNKEITIQSPDNQKFATQFTLEDAQNYVDQHKNELWSNLPEDAVMFVKDIDYSQVAEGKVSFKTDTSEYYNQSGELITNTQQSAGYHTLVINGFNHDSQALTTTVSGVVQIDGMNQVLAQDATNGAYWNDIKSQVISALSSGNYVQNLTNGANVNQLNSSNTDLHCNPKKVPEDKEIIGSDIFWNNIDGTITVRLVIYNNMAWKDGISQTQMSFPLKISGFKKVAPTTQNQQTISVSNFNNTDWSQKLATDFNSSNINDFINQNKSAIFNNLPDGATLSIVGNPTYSNKDGTITIQVNTNQYYSDQNGTQYINGSMPNPITVTLNGFVNNNTDSSLFNTKVSNATLSGVNTIIPDSLTNPLQGATQEEINQYMTTIKNAIISANCVSNPAQGQTFTADDIEITNIQPNNKDGQITCSVTINNSKAQVNGDPVASYTQDNVVFSGFSNQCQPTTINPNLNLPNVSNQLPVSVTKDDIQNAINNNPDLKNQIGTNLPPNANITVDNVDTSDPSLSDNGQVKVTVSISPSYDANGNLTDTPIQQTIIVGGFKPSENVNTTIANPNFNLSNVPGINDILPTDVAGSNSSSNEVNQLTDAIKQYIVDNQDQIFSNLNPNDKLTKDDITIGNLTTPINKNGSVHLDSIIINGSKVLVNGQPSQSNVTLNNNDEGFNLSGLKTQVPTSWNNFNTQSNIGNVTLAGANQIEVGSVTNDSLTSLINQSQSNKDQFLSNLPSDATISATIDSNGYDLANGTITCTVTASSSFDSNGNPAGSISNKYVIGQFIKNTSTTTVNNVDLTNQANTIPSEINASNQDAIINDIKNQLINSGAIQNTNPTVTTPISPNDINVTITGSDNLTGKVKVDVTVNNPYYMENGQVTTQTTPTQIEVGGFKTLQPTNVPDSVVSNAIGNDKNINQIVNDPNTISNIQNAISNALDNNMFPSGTKPSPDQIKVEITNQDPANGSCTVKVTIPGPYVDDQGNIINQDRVIEVPISGCPKDASTTNVISGTLNNCNNIIPSDLEKNNSILNNQVMQAMIDAGLIKNLTSGKTGFTINDMTIENIKGNNLNGSATIDVTIKNGYACKDGTSQNSMTFKSVTINGLMKLSPTEFNDPIQCPNSLTQTSPSDLVNSQNQQQTEDIIKQLIANQANNNPSGNMFPIPNTPLTPDDIKIKNITVDDSNGTISVQVSINRDYVDASGQIVKGPYNNKKPIIISGFKPVENSNWAENNWWIILVSVIGTALLLLVILLIVKKSKDRDSYLYGY